MRGRRKRRKAARLDRGINIIHSASLNVWCGRSEETEKKGKPALAVHHSVRQVCESSLQVDVLSGSRRVLASPKARQRPNECTLNAREEDALSGGGTIHLLKHTEHGNYQKER